jgi:hypothetical protein
MEPTTIPVSANNESFWTDVVAVMEGLEPRAKTDAVIDARSMRWRLSHFEIEPCAVALARPIR